MSTKKLCAMGLLVALTCVATMIIQIPIPATQGYVNIGDSIVLISAIFFGPQVGFVAGGLGSGLADLLSGYPQWAIATFIIKGIEGLVAGMIAHKYSVNKNFVNVYTILASVVAMVIMVVGSFLGGSVLEGVSASIGSVPSNAMQAVASLIIFFVLGFALYKAKIYKYFD